MKNKQFTKVFTPFNVASKCGQVHPVSFKHWQKQSFIKSTFHKLLLCLHVTKTTTRRPWSLQTFTRTVALKEFKKSSLETAEPNGRTVVSVTFQHAGVHVTYQYDSLKWQPHSPADLSFYTASSKLASSGYWFREAGLNRSQSRGRWERCRRLESC